MRRLRNGQLYSAGLTRVGSKATVRRPLGPPSSGISKDGSYGTKSPTARWASPLRHRGFPVPYGSPEFGCSFASRCDKGSAGKRPGAVGQRARGLLVSRPLRPL